MQARTYSPLLWQGKQQASDKDFPYRRLLKCYDSIADMNSLKIGFDFNEVIVISLSFPYG